MSAEEPELLIESAGVSGFVEFGEHVNTIFRMNQAFVRSWVVMERLAGAAGDGLVGRVHEERFLGFGVNHPEAFVQIDPHQNRVVKGQWPSEHNRPVYFVELRDDRYACSWCDHEGSRLMLVPYPQSPVPIRSFRYPQEAEIIGRVTGIAQLIAELHSEISV